MSNILLNLLIPMNYWSKILKIITLKGRKKKKNQKKDFVNVDDMITGSHDAIMFWKKNHDTLKTIWDGMDGWMDGWMQWNPWLYQRLMDVGWYLWYENSDGKDLNNEMVVVMMMMMKKVMVTVVFAGMLKTWWFVTRIFIFLSKNKSLGFN